MLKKEVSKKQIVDLLWKHSYGNWNNDNLGEYATSVDIYPDYLANILHKYFIIYKRNVKEKT